MNTARLEDLLTRAIDAPDDGRLFSQVVRESLAVLPVSPWRLVERLGVNRLRIEEWKAGRQLPDVAGRLAVYDLIMGAMPVRESASEAPPAEPVDGRRKRGRGKR